MAILYKEKLDDGLYDGYDKTIYEEIGEQGEKEVCEAILNMLSNEYVLLNSVYMVTPEGDFTEIDHIVIHPRFIACIETKNYAGDFISINEEVWEQTNRKTGEKRRIDSPQAQSLYHAQSIQTYLKVNNIELPVYNFVVFINSNKVNYDKSTDERYQDICPVIYKKNIHHLMEVIEQQTINLTQKEDVCEVAEVILSEHEGIKNSPLFYYKKLAMNEDDRDAMYKLGCMFYDGGFQDRSQFIAIPKNEKASYFWLKKASDKGSALAKRKLLQIRKK